MALGTTGMVAVAAVVAGLAGAGAALAVRGGGSATPPVDAESRRVADLEERFAKQDAEIRTLLARVEEISLASHGPSGTAPGAAPQSAHNEDGTPRDGSASGGAGDANTPIGGDPNARHERMRDVRGALRTRTEGESAEKRRKSIEDGVRSRLDALPAELNFTASQKDSVVRLMTERQDKVRIAFEEARASSDPDAMRGAQQKAEEARKESRTALEAILTPEQLAAWERAGDRGQAGGGGGGRRAARGAGGGTPPAGGGETPK